MSISQARLAVERGEALLVDVRPAGQRALGHIRGDAALPLEQLAARQAELPRDRRLVFYCSCPAEESALQAAGIIFRAGYSNLGVLVGGYDAWRAAGGAIETEGTWEEIFHVTAPPSGWGKTPMDSTRCRYAVDRHIAAQGSASGCVTCLPDSTARGFGGFSQRLDPRPLVNRTVTLTAMVRTENVVPAADLWMAVQDSQGHMIARVRAEGDPIRGTQEWRRCEVSGVVPPGSGKLLIGCSLLGSGRIWLDDVRLLAPAERGLPPLPIVIANPDFEE